MQEFREAIDKARSQGYLVTGTGRSWLACEVAWRRYCQAVKMPAVIVSQRTTRAYVYMFLRNVPHANRSDQELEGMVAACGDHTDKDEKVTVIRGVRGKPDLFLGVSVENLSTERAQELAPYLLTKAREMMLEQSQVAAGT